MMDLRKKRKTYSFKDLKSCGVESKDTFREFGDVTTLHGVRYITDTRTSLLEKIGWSIAVLIFIIWCGIEIQKVYTKWKENPVITTLAQKPMSVSDIPFPAITICPENKILKSKYIVDHTVKFKKSFLNLSDSSNDEFLMYEAFEIGCKGGTRRQLTLNMIHRVAEIAPKLEDIFESCAFNNNFQDCKSIFRPIMMTDGLCFVFNLINDSELFTDIVNKEIISEYIPWSTSTTTKIKNQFMGSITGLSIILKLKNSEVQEECSRIKGSENFKFRLHSPIELPAPASPNFLVSPNTQLRVSIRPDLTKTVPELGSSKYDAKTRGCTLPEETSSFAFKYKTKSNRLFDGILQNSVKYCNCSFFVVPIKDKNNNTLDFCSLNSGCVIMEGLKRYNNDIRSIIPSCDDLKYKIYSTSANYKYKGNEHRKNNLQYSYSEVNIFFEDQVFFPWQKSELFGFTDLLASSGGLLGLFTGFSFITAIEIIYFITIKFICRLRKRSNAEATNIQSSELQSVTVITDDEPPNIPD